MNGVQSLDHYAFSVPADLCPARGVGLQEKAIFSKNKSVEKAVVLNLPKRLQIQHDLNLSGLSE